MSSINVIGQVAAGYADAMNTHAAKLQDTTIAEDPSKLAIFQIELNKLSQAYQLTARTIQNLHREDQLLSELLRDA